MRSVSGPVSSSTAVQLLTWLVKLTVLELLISCRFRVVRYQLVM